jgi:hypothetical protein
MVATMDREPRNISTYGPEDWVRFAFRLIAVGLAFAVLLMMAGLAGVGWVLFHLIAGW